MKFKFSFLTALFIIGLSFNSSAQEMAKKAGDMMMKDDHKMVKSITLEQTKGEFTVKSLTLSEGDYIFNISNSGIDSEVGFVLAPAGKTDAENHIKEAYVTAPVAKDKSQKTNIVHLTKGEYVYFCPLNPTPQYTLTVK